MAKDLLRERLAKYIPPKEEWTPVDEALYGVEDIYNVPDDKAKKLREDAIRYSFKHHYEGNKFYHEYCKGVNIKTEEDFKKIPLVPDRFFKDYPDIEEGRGRGFLE
jgi:phenylacetate-coenzyme A ligase PaaK-like adenylate-forming protein